MDWRVSFLHFGALHPLLLNLLFLGIFLPLGTLASMLEYDIYCESDLKWWVIPMVARLFLRWISLACVFYVRGDTKLYEYFIDLLDSFGIVWFIRGNALLFGYTKCASISPWLYSVSTLYIGSGYIPVLVSLLLIVSPPQDYPHRGIWLDWEGRCWIDLQRYQVGNTAALLSCRWKQWLENHGSYEYVVENGDGGECAICLQSLRHKPFTSQASIPSQLSQGSHHANHQSSQLPGSNTNVVQESPPGTSGKDITGEANDLQLEVIPLSPPNLQPLAIVANPTAPQEDTVAVVQYPCECHHVFHATCLHQWLQACYERSRSENSMTCPCCRQGPRQSIAATNSNSQNILLV